MEEDKVDAPIKIDKEVLKAKGLAVSDCMLEQWYGTAAGLLIGTPLGIRRKSLRPFVVAITAGTLADYLMGDAKCRTLSRDFKEAKAAFEAQEKRDKEQADSFEG